MQGIGVRKQQPLAVGMLRAYEGGLALPCPACAQWRRIEYLNICETGSNFACAIGRVIVDDDHLEINAFLGDQRSQTASDRTFFIARRNDYRYVRTLDR